MRTRASRRCSDRAITQRRSKHRAQAPSPGIYADHKGRLQRVLRAARCADSQAELVIHEDLASGDILVSTLSSFNGFVEAFGSRYRRFTPADAINLFVLAAAHQRAA